MKVSRAIRARLKTRQRWQRCPGCGGKGTQSHHLFVRRPDHPMIHEDWNIVQVCPKCHMEEQWEMQVWAARLKIRQYGAGYIVAKVAALPCKVPPALPAHFWEARAREENTS